MVAEHCESYFDTTLHLETAKHFIPNFFCKLCVASEVWLIQSLYLFAAGPFNMVLLIMVLWSWRPLWKNRELTKNIRQSSPICWCAPTTKLLYKPLLSKMTWDHLQQHTPRQMTPVSMMVGQKNKILNI